MSSEKKSPNTDTEYQFGTEDVAPESRVDPAVRKAPSLRVIVEKLREKLPKKKKGKVLIILGIVLYIAYQLFSTPTPKVPTTPSEASIEAQKKVSQPLSKPQEPGPVTPKVEPVIVPEPPAEELKKTLFEPEKSTKTATTPPVSEELASKIKAVDQSLNTMNDSLSNIQSSLLTLTNSAITLSRKVNTLEGYQQAEMRSFQKSAAQYYLQSLFSGRVWLHSFDGELITVRVGDTIPGYGEISGIDNNKGVVMTTSGREISYGPNDH